LKRETAQIKTALDESVDLAAFAENWLGVKENDDVDVLLAEIFLEEFKAQMPRLATSYIKRIDSELVVTQITQRTAAWIEEWSEELGRLMKLTAHREVENLLAVHLHDGKSVAELARAFMDSGTREEYYRARTASLTEMLRAHSVAQQEAIIQNPAVSEKEWVHTGSYRNNPRENHAAMNGVLARKDQPFSLVGADGSLYFPMYPRDTCLPAGESINCHCIHRGIADADMLGLSLEERKRLQEEAIAADDGAWERERDASNMAQAGIEENLLTNPRKDNIIDTEGLNRGEDDNLRIPMDEAKYNRCKTAFERNGGEIVSSPELNEYLDMRGADAITYNQYLIVFRHGSSPTASEFFEEFIHTSQFRQGRVSTGITVELEIEAKEKLIRNQAQYGIPDHENEQTKNQLRVLYQILNNER